MLPKRKKVRTEADKNGRCIGDKIYFKNNTYTKDKNIPYYIISFKVTKKNKNSIAYFVLDGDGIPPRKPIYSKNEYFNEYHFLKK